MERLTRLLAEHPKRILISVTLLLLPLLSFFLIYSQEIECDVRRGFANKNGRAIKEFQRFSDFYNISFEGLEIWGILVKSRSEGGFLKMNAALLDEIERLELYVKEFQVKKDGATISFNDTTAADLNFVFHYYKKLYPLDGWLPGLNLSFPMSSAFGTTFFIGSQFFGVNQHRPDTTGPIEKFRFLTLWYMSKAETAEERRSLQAVQMGIFGVSAQNNFSRLFSFEMFGDQVANAEMLRGTLTTVKLFVVGAALMIAFMAFNFSQLTVKSQVMLIIGAIGSPIVATCSCFALLGWFGQEFNSIMCITPFLILGIGVDDAFLLLHCWRRESSMPSKSSRLRSVVLEISPSMAITSITNTMAFSVGFLSPTPQMSSFCLCTAVAILLDFLFEFLIFVPCMVLYYEEKSHKKLLIEQNNINSSTGWTKFVNLLLSPAGQILGLSLYLTLLASSYYGVTTLETTFDPSKTFPSDSKLVEALQDFTFIQEEYTPVNYLTKTPNLSNDTEMASFEKMVRELENRNNCYGSERSQNMYWDYVEYLRSSNNSVMNYNKLEDFFKQRGMNDVRMVKYHQEGNETKVDVLNFLVICRGENDWGSRASALESSRRIIDRYPQFQVSLFDYDATIYDLIITVKGELIKSVFITFSCMTMACFVIMPSCIAPTIASVATLSISYCLVGFLSIWGQNLDPVTMIVIIMAIGFSVDYSAHVCFNYYCACRAGPKNQSKKALISGVLNAVGRPLIEASLTTLLCMLPLFVVPVYIIRSFAKTVTLVTTFGLLHALLFLPILLYAIPMRKPKNRFVSVPTNETCVSEIA
ncbi:unnamed protein product [Caenorhabditis auriculariae]|uniref:SSD domain-containing protein n=1 Tax=Caenorhabditis auriculariae TaxID=2777116 RepID=A0A8S1HCD5_9PELO|nr:unnamed protein product [Caenorhabditis auriculariae]